MKTTNKVLIAHALIATAANPPAFDTKAYAPASYKEEKLASQHFAYQYGAVDDYFMNNFQGLRLRMLREKFLDLSPLAESRPPDLHC